MQPAPAHRPPPAMLHGLCIVLCGVVLVRRGQCASDVSASTHIRKYTSTHIRTCISTHMRTRVGGGNGGGRAGAGPLLEAGNPRSWVRRRRVPPRLEEACQLAYHAAPCG